MKIQQSAFCSNLPVLLSNFHCRGFRSRLAASILQQRLWWNGGITDRGIGGGTAPCGFMIDDHRWPIRTKRPFEISETLIALIIAQKWLVIFSDPKSWSVCLSRFGHLWPKCPGVSENWKQKNAFARCHLRSWLEQPSPRLSRWEALCKMLWSRQGKTEVVQLLKDALASLASLASLAKCVSNKAAVEIESSIEDDTNYAEEPQERFALHGLSPGLHLFRSDGNNFDFDFWDCLSTLKSLCLANHLTTCRLVHITKSQINRRRFRSLKQRENFTRFKFGDQDFSAENINISKLNVSERNQNYLVVNVEKCRPW